MKNHLKIHSTIWLSPQIFLLAGFLAFGMISCAAQQQNDEDTATVYQNYVPPPWAPPYDNVSTVRYYYLPDYETYYDVWGRQFWYLGPDGEWIYSVGPPPPIVGVDLSGSFVVLIDRDIDRPWERHEYYRDNYPRHGYEHYRDIVVHNRIVTNTEPGHELVPRAFNENNNRVTFMQRPNQPPPPPNIGESRGEQNHGEQPPAGSHQPPAPPVMPQLQHGNYHHVVHEVPMRNISPNMPAESRKYNYGNGYTKGSVPPPRQTAPARTAAPRKDAK